MKQFDNRKLGERISEERTRKNITQDQLAEMIDSSNVVISRIENNAKSCGLDYMVNIANALGVSLTVLNILTRHPKRLKSEISFPVVLRKRKQFSSVHGVPPQVA